MNEIVAILGVPFDNLTMGEAVNRIFDFIDDYAVDHRPRIVATANVDFIVKSLTWGFRWRGHMELLDILRRADLVTADGMPIVKISKLLGTPLKERITGVDLIPEIAAQAEIRKKSVYFLGARQDIAERAANKLKQRYPGLIVAGASSPDVTIEGEAIAMEAESDHVILDHIHSCRPDILLMAFGNPKQEIWFERNRHHLKVPVSIGVGAAFDFISDTVPRAPKHIQEMGYEWLHRLFTEPKRLWRRYLGNFFKFRLLVWPLILSDRYRRFRLGFRRDREKPTIRYSIVQAVSDQRIRMLSFPTQLDSRLTADCREEVQSFFSEADVMVLDFERVEFIDAVGFGFLLRIWRFCQKHRRKLFFTGISRTIVRSFKVNYIEDILADRHIENLTDILRCLFLDFFYISDRYPNYVMLKLIGRLDASSVKTMTPENIIPSDYPSNCILDLTHLTFIDSTGLAFLIKIRKRVALYNKRCLICNANKNIRQMFKITKLDGVFEHVTGVSAASRALKSR